MIALDSICSILVRFKSLSIHLAILSVFVGTTGVLSAQTVTSSAIPVESSQEQTSEANEVLVENEAVAELSAAGCWSGGWLSCRSGHRGPMSATIVECGPDLIRADFRGRFFKVFPFKYSVTLRVIERQPDAIVLGGQSYLGRIFGTFSYTATVTEDSFEAVYRSRKDWGKFSMRR